MLDMIVNLCIFKMLISEISIKIFTALIISKESCGDVLILFQLPHKN